MFYVACPLASAHKSSGFMAAKTEQFQLLVAISSNSVVEVEVVLEGFLKHSLLFLLK